MTYFNTKSYFQDQRMSFQDLLERIWSRDGHYFHVFWALATLAAVSFLVTFWRGPPAPRTQTTLQVVLTLVGVFLVYVGLSEDTIMATGIVGVFLLMLHVKLPRWARYMLFPLFLARAVLKAVLNFVMWPLRSLYKLVFKLVFRQKPRPFLTMEDYELIGEKCVYLLCRWFCVVLCQLAMLCRAVPSVMCCAFSDVLCCVVLVVLCCAVLCCAVLCCAMLCCAVLCCAVLCCAVLCCTAVQCSAVV